MYVTFAKFVPEPFQVFRGDSELSCVEFAVILLRQPHEVVVLAITTASPGLDVMGVHILTVILLTVDGVDASLGVETGILVLRREATEVEIGIDLIILFATEHPLVDTVRLLVDGSAVTDNLLRTLADVHLLLVRERHILVLVVQSAPILGTNGLVGLRLSVVEEHVTNPVNHTLVVVDEFICVLVSAVVEHIGFHGVVGIHELSAVASPFDSLLEAFLASSVTGSIVESGVLSHAVVGSLVVDFVRIRRTGGGEVTLCGLKPYVTGKTAVADLLVGENGGRLVDGVKPVDLLVFTAFADINLYLIFLNPVLPDLGECGESSSLHFTVMTESDCQIAVYELAKSHNALLSVDVVVQESVHTVFNDTEVHDTDWTVVENGVYEPGFPEFVIRHDIGTLIRGSDTEFAVHCNDSADVLLRVVSVPFRKFAKRKFLLRHLERADDGFNIKTHSESFLFRHKFWFDKIFYPGYLTRLPGDVLVDIAKIMQISQLLVILALFLATYENSRVTPSPVEVATFVRNIAYFLTVRCT